MPRVNEHFYEAACVSTSTATCAKPRLLKVELACDLGALVVFAGPDLQPALTTAWHGPTMGELRKNNMSHCAAPRRRPSKHIRQARGAQAHAVKRPHHLEMSRPVQLDVRRRAGQVHQHANESACVSLLSRPFPVIYALCLAAHVRDTNTCGPVAVVGQFSHLLVARICHRPAMVEWHRLLNQPRGYRRLFRLYDLLQLVPTSGRRKLGLRRLQVALKLAGEPPAKRFTLRVPPEVGLPAARMVLRQCAPIVARHCPHRRAWMRRHIKLCLGPRATNQSKLARCCDVHGLRAKPAGWTSSAIRGQDLIRVKK